jgi:hypothetical protein
MSIYSKNYLEVTYAPISHIQLQDKKYLDLKFMNHVGIVLAIIENKQRKSLTWYNKTHNKTNSGDSHANFVLMNLKQTKNSTYPFLLEHANLKRL